MIAIACILGLTVTAGSLIRLLREPFHLGLCVPPGMGGLLIALSLAPPGSSAQRVLAILLLLACLALALWLPLLGLASRRRPLTRAPELLLVPGYALHRGRMTRTLELRLQSALILLQAYPASRVLLSGGAPRGDATEAACMRRWLQERGIAPERILTEETSCSSWQNLLHCRALHRQLGAPETVLVTSWWHMLRMLIFAHRLQWPLYTLPCPVPGLLIVPEAAREAMILVKTALFGPDSMSWANGRL